MPAASIGSPADTSASLALPLLTQDSDTTGWSARIEPLLARAVKPQGKREGLGFQISISTAPMLALHWLCRLQALRRS